MNIETMQEDWFMICIAIEPMKKIVHLFDK